MQKDTKFLNKSNIFIKNINNKYKLIPFNIKINFVGENKYFPSDFKEWTNNIYYFNSNYIKNFPVWWFGKSSLIWDKLSNSGNVLKSLVPSNTRKVISGWSNYSCMVISQWMNESEMDNRGSKSVLFNNLTVKEQRVKGSYCINGIQLRCTLVGFERNYQVKIPSNQIINKSIRYFSNSAPVTPLIDPWFITGFADAESSFVVSIKRNKKIKCGWNVVTRFQIALSQKDLALLERIKSYFKDAGNIYIKSDKVSVDWHVTSVKDLKIILDHFDKYPLKTEKLADYILFKEVFNIILTKQHLTVEGIQKIVAIRASINKGLYGELKAAFPNIIPVQRPKIDDRFILDIQPWWVAGFTEGEGCFSVVGYKFAFY
uniref:Ribosomal protein 3/homing endonuclease-like fusion protein n=1 Tax=Grosmannia laricis TaxID=150547 RepID=C7SWF5_9PEZI|nr:ribosomal protein 3/homing endonuclease-like fusion protein [Grosmannia laricis]